GEVIPAGGIVTPVVPNSGTYVKDLGVTDAKAIPLKRVSSAPTPPKKMEFNKVPLIRPKEALHLMVPLPRAASTAN
ncbi:hypothetical protein IAF14_18720, partial [Acinetobacter baumannii]|nr:hypothetical protein [Acinetobacter baumannii]